MFHLKFQKTCKIWIKGKMYCNKNTKDKPRSFFDNIDKWAKEVRVHLGLAYLTIEKMIKFLQKVLLESFFQKIL